MFNVPTPIYLYLGTCIYSVVCAQDLNKKEGRIPRGRIVIGHTVYRPKTTLKKKMRKRLSAQTTLRFLRGTH